MSSPRMQDLWNRQKDYRGRPVVDSEIAAGLYRHGEELMPHLPVVIRASEMLANKDSYSLQVIQIEAEHCEDFAAL